MANIFLEDPNNLGKLFNSWQPQNIVVNRETATNAFITNLTVQNFTGGGVQDTFTNLTTNNFKLVSVMTGQIGSFIQFQSNATSTNSLIIPSSSALNPYTGNVNISNTVSGQKLYVGNGPSPFTITFSSAQNGYNYQVITTAVLVKPVTLAFPSLSLNGTILGATGSNGFPANQRFTSLSNAILNGTGMSQPGDRYFIDSDTTNFYISGITQLGSAVTTS
jgi:hypothetical protein